MEQILEPKTQLIAALAAATAGKCRGCFTKLYDMARQLGLTDAELRAAVDIGARVSRTSHDLMRAFIEEATGGIVRAPADGESHAAGCGCR